jgi:hypothetical protein
MGNLASGFNSMRLNPDQGLDRRVQGQQQGRRDANRRNSTIEWLLNQPGGEKFATMADSVGVGPALQAYQAAQQGADPVNGINVGGNLVNPRTGELMYQGAGDADLSAAEQQIARMESIGIPRDVAIRVADGVLTTSLDPTTRAVTIIDKTTGQVVFGGAPNENVTLPPDASPPPTVGTPAGGADATDSFGLEGMVKSVLNAGTDFFGIDTPFEGVRDSQADFAVLREGLVNDISQGYGQRVPSWLLQNIQALTPQAGTFQGAGNAQSKLNALNRSFGGEISNLNVQLQGNLSPTQRQTIEGQIASLTAAQGKVNSALSQFGASGEDNQTSTGVTWSFE